MHLFRKTGPGIVQTDRFINNSVNENSNYILLRPTTEKKLMQCKDKIKDDYQEELITQSLIRKQFAIINSLDRNDFLSTRNHEKPLFIIRFCETKLIAHVLNLRIFPSLPANFSSLLLIRYISNTTPFT